MSRRTFPIRFHAAVFVAVLTSDRLDSICSRLSCAADGSANTYCRLDVSASEVTFP